MIYILTTAKIAPGEPDGTISDLFEAAFTDIIKAEAAFDALPLSPTYFKKEILGIDVTGRRACIKVKTYREALAEFDKK